MTIDPNLIALEMAAAELGSLLDDVVLVGGCAVGLLITDPASPPVRQTADVDVITEVAPATEYYRFCEKLRAQGFSEDGDVICRWRKWSLLVDIMPIDNTILGFTNSWYPEAIKTANKHKLKSGRIINIISARVFVATKLESFLDRGHGDFTHHDIEDIINLINGRDSLCNEIRASNDAVKQFITDEIDTMLGTQDFIDYIDWHLRPLNLEQRKDIVLSRLREIAGI